jgi:putative endonuclease
LSRYCGTTPKSTTGPAFAMHIVYVLKCADGDQYIGCTENLEERLDRHRTGQVTATADRLPMALDFYFATPNKYKAFEADC